MNSQKSAFLPRFCILFVLIASVGSLFAQSDNKFKPEWNFGINGGATLSYVDFMPRIKTKLLEGNTFGISVRYISENHFGLIGEINYIQQGWEQDFTETDSICAYSRPISYLEIPVLTHIYFGRKARFVFNFGPKISFKLSEKEKMNTALTELIASGDATTTLGVTDQYGKTVEKNFDYGLVVGTGMELRTGIGNFILEGRFYFGLGDLFNSTKSDYFSRSANRVVSAKLTYFIKPF